MSFTAIGDAHGKYDRYVEMAKNKDFTVQLGDLGFKYGCLDNLDPESHKLLGGNHDNYDVIKDYPHYLGDYGNCVLGGTEFFFYRGAYSIDRDMRTIGIDWWAEEENTIEVFMEARELYRSTKPKVVISHCCPHSVIAHFLRPQNTYRVFHTRTDWALEELLNIHRPELWVFGHYHISRSVDVDGTKFVCLNELETIEI